MRGTYSFQGSELLKRPLLSGDTGGAKARTGLAPEPSTDLNPWWSPLFWPVAAWQDRKRRREADLGSFIFELRPRYDLVTHPDVFQRFNAFFIEKYERA